MSNERNQASAKAAMRVSHLAQIEALTAPGLYDRERVLQFFKAIGSDWHPAWETKGKQLTPASFCWSYTGEDSSSLFAFIRNQPWDGEEDCGCPVQRGCPGVVEYVDGDWKPTAQQLEVFSKIQLDARF